MWNPAVLVVPRSTPSIVESSTGSSATLGPRSRRSPSTSTSRTTRFATGSNASRTKGVVRGYSADVDYNAIGVQHHYQFIRTARVSEREELAEEALGIPGVVEVRTLMTGSRNTYVTAGSDNDDITRIAMAIDGIGLGIDEESLVRREIRQPLERFRLENAE